MKTLLTLNEIKDYKRHCNLASYYHRKSDASLYAKIKCHNIMSLEEKLKAQKEHESLFMSLPIEQQSNIAFKMQKGLE